MIRRLLYEEPTYTAPTAKSLTYNSSAQALLNAGSTSHGYFEYSSDGSTWSTTIPTGTNAGTYTPQWRLIGDGWHSCVIAKSITVTIAKKAITCSAPTAKSLTYNGSAQALANAGSVAGGSMTYCSTSGGTYSSTMPTGTNAGSYTVWYKGTATDSNYSGTCSGSVNCSIAKCTPTLSTTPSYVSNWTYDATAHNLLTGGAMKGCVNESVAGTFTYDQGTNVGTYTNKKWYFTPTDTTNYSSTNGTITGSVTCNCKPCTAPTAKSLTYNGSAQALVNAGSTTYGTMVYSTSSTGTYSTTIPTGTNANSYEVWWKVTGNTNVCCTAAAKVACSIGAKTVSSPTITLSPSSYVYSNSACQPTPTVQDGSTTIASSEYTVSYSNNINAGTATCTITDKSGGNYIVSGSKTFTISKYTPTAPTAKNPNWTGSAQNLVNAGSTSYGTMVYSTTSGGTYSTTIPQGTNAGSYEVWWKVTGNTNVNNTEPTKISCSINKVAMTYTAPSGRTLDYSGSAQALMTGGAATGGSIQYSTASTGTYSTTVPTQTNAGTYTTWWKAVPDSNHSGGTNAASANTTINKVAMTYTAPKVTTYTYANTARNLVSGASANGGSIQYCATSGGTYSTTVPTQTNAGTYDTWWKAVPDGNHTGGTSAAKLTTTINCYSATAPTAKSLTYNGSAQALVNAGSTSYGTVVYSTDNSTFNTTIPSGTSAGSYTVYWKVTGNTNVCQTTSASISCSIKQVAMSYTAPSAATRTYTGSAQQIVSGGSANGGNIYYATSSAGASSSTTVPSQTNAGSYTVYWKAVPDGNHSGGTSSWVAISCTIAQAAMTYTAPKAAVRTYNGSAQQIVSGQSAAGGSIYYATSSAGASSSTTVPTQTNTGTTYSTYWKAVPDSNHSGGTDSWAQITGCTINKATLTITAKAQTINYGGSITTGVGQVTTSGLVAGDSLTAITLTPSTSNVPGGVITPSAGATSKGIGNYSVTYNTGTLTINKVAMTYTAPKAAVRTYNGSAQQIVSGQSAGGGSIQFCSTSDGTYTTTVPTQTNTGTSYSTWWKAVPDSNHSGGTSAAQITGCTINKAALTITAKAQTVNYGTAITTGTGQVTVTGLVNGDSLTSITLTPSTSNVPGGTITPSAGATSKGISNYSVTYNTGTLTINKVAMTSCTPTAKSVTYNGSSQAVVNDCTPTGGDIYYATSSAGASSSTTVPSQTSVGTWTYYWKAIPDSNHSGGTSSWAALSNCKVTAKALTITAKAQTINYGSSITTGVGQVTTDGLVNGDSLTAITLTPSTSNVPGGTITPSAGATTKGIGNYSVTYNTGALTINKVAVDCCTPTAKSGLVYNANSQAIVNDCNCTGGDIYYATSNTGTGSATTVPSKTDAGSWTYYWKCIPDSNHSGGTSSWASLSCTIACKPCTAPTAKSLTWTGSAQALVNAGSTSYGTMMYSLNNSDWSSSIPSGTNATSYTVYWKVSGNTNVCCTASSSVSVTIAKAAMSCCTPTPKTGLVYNGSSQTLVNDCAPIGGDIYYATSNTGTGSGTSVPSQTNAGSWTYYYKCIPDSNHSGGSSSWTALSCAITCQTCTTVTAPTPKSGLVYNGSQQALLNAGAASNGCTMYYMSTGGTWSTSAPTAVNAGSYDVLLYEPRGNDSNHCTGTRQVTEGSIAKAPISCTPPTPITGITYDGNPHVLVNAGSCGGGTMKYSRTGTVWTDELPTETEPGTYNIIYNCVPDSNHSGSCSGSFTVEITNPSGTYLTFIATDACVFKFTKAVSYSLNDGAWTSLASNTSVSVSSGSNIRWKATLSPGTSGVGCFSGSSGHFTAMGNPASLISGDSFNSLTTLPGYAFFCMFKGCTGMTSAEHISLEYDTAAAYNGNSVNFYAMFEGCTSLTVGPTHYNIGTVNGNGLCRNMFSGCTSLTRAMPSIGTAVKDFHCLDMFDGCTSLTSAPELPATTLYPETYDGMFKNCTSLTNAPVLSSTTLAARCYHNMFAGCTSLTTAPDLPATTLATSAYTTMFSGCTNLNYIKAMFTTTPSSTYTLNWVSGVASSGTFVKNSAATWTNTFGNNAIPPGWNVQTSSS